MFWPIRCLPARLRDRAKTKTKSENKKPKEHTSFQSMTASVQFVKVCWQSQPGLQTYSHLRHHISLHWESTSHARLHRLVFLLGDRQIAVFSRNWRVHVISQRRRGCWRHMTWWKPTRAAARLTNAVTVARLRQDGKMARRQPQGPYWPNGGHAKWRHLPHRKSSIPSTPAQQR